MAVTAYIGLGANLGDPIATLHSAITELRQIPGSRLLATSSLYRSAPLGPPGQPDYINAAACIETDLAPHALLSELQAIENQHGRIREVRWGARTLDLDLLLFGNDEIQTTSLIVPHLELKNRNFVVIPLLELTPGLHLPDGKPLAALPVASNRAGLDKLPA